MVETKAGVVDASLDRLIWIDLEMTGLVVEKEVIIEIATVVTDAELNVVAQGPVIAVSQPEAYLQNMDEWNTRQHTKSGLVSRVQASKVDVASAEAQTLAFLKTHVAANQSPMCGNSICQDRRFMARYMPELEAFFHYRNLDVSTLKELARRWQPSVLKQVQKRGSHLALDDIMDSILELKVYKRCFFDD